VRSPAFLALGLLTLVSACNSRSAPLPPAEQRAVDERPVAKANEAALVNVTPPAAELSESEQPNACAPGMVLVEGDYCPDVALHCEKYADPPGRYRNFRCLQYSASTCRSKERKHLRYCIDKHEYTPSGETLPANNQSWSDADRTCRSLGKRVCQESEYVFACEGEEMRPYPYGFSRDSEACNADRSPVVDDRGELRDLRAPSGAYSRCLSPFGVADLAGNLEEFVTITGSNPPRPAMKGAYWQPGRNFCRAAQTAHDKVYKGTETGFRCCDDAGE
jgi:formylglycine-generating enzyme